MDWAKIITDRARISGILRVDELACEFELSELVVANALRRQEKRGLVEHLGKKIFINRLVNDFSGRELINILRPRAYLSLESVLRESGVSTQSPFVLTCITTGRPGTFRAKSLALKFHHLSENLFWGFKERIVRYGKYNLAEPEKALLDWVYLHRKAGSLTAMDEFDLHRLDRAKLLQYAARYPTTVQQQIYETVANFNIVPSGADEKIQSA